MLFLGKDYCENIIVLMYLFFVISLFIVLIIVVVFLGNFFVIFVVCINFNKDMRLLFNYFIVNLSFVDFIVGFIIVLLGMGYYIIVGFGVEND